MSSLSRPSQFIQLLFLLQILIESNFAGVITVNLIGVRDDLIGVRDNLIGLREVTNGDSS